MPRQIDTKTQGEIGTKAPIVVTKLGMIKPRVKRQGKVATGARRPREVAIGAGKSEKAAMGARRLGRQEQ